MGEDDDVKATSGSGCTLPYVMIPHNFSKPSGSRRAPAPANYFVKGYRNHITRAEQYKSFRATNRVIVDSGNTGDNIFGSSSYAHFQKLETKLKSMLKKARGRAAPSSSTADDELHVYSHVFEKLIEQSGAYKPMLREIKHEYDTYLERLAAKSRGLDHLQRKVEAKTDGDIEDMIRQRLEENKEIEQVLEAQLKEKRRLQDEIAKQNRLNQMKVSCAALNLDGQGEKGSGKERNLKATQIAELHQSIARHIDIITQIKTDQRTRFVPLSAKTWIQESIAEVDEALLDCKQEIAKIQEEKQRVEQSLSSMLT